MILSIYHHSKTVRWSNIALSLLGRKGHSVFGRSNLGFLLISSLFQNMPTFVGLLWIWRRLLEQHGFHATEDWEFRWVRGALATSVVTVLVQLRSPWRSWFTQVRYYKSLVNISSTFFNLTSRALKLPRIFTTGDYGH
jgi:hypothetical protein